MDSAQTLIDEIRSKRKLHRHIKFLIGVCFFILSVDLAIVALNYLLARYM